jgi:thioredoxin reductase (NADPH)
MDYQLVIIGSGPAGMTAGLYASRAMMKTLILDKMGSGGQMLKTHWIDNYPGFVDGVSSAELTEKMLNQAKRFGLEEKYGEVSFIEAVSRKHFRINLVDGNSIDTNAIIITTGAGPKTLNVPGEKEFTGRGVSYCATCDGFFYRGQDIAVVGGGDSAVQEALFLTKFAKKIYLIHRRDRLRATGVVQEMAFKEPKIELVWNTTIEKINGENEVTGITVKNKISGEIKEIALTGVFIYVGIEPYTDFMGDLIKKDSLGFIITDEWMKTSCEGIYAAGDCRAKPLRQIITACGEGATAAYAVEHYLLEL